MLPTKNDKFGVSSMAEAMKWVSVVTSVVGVMLVPALGGIWIDNLLGTKFLFMILGVIVGFAGGLYCLLEMVKVNAKMHRSRRLSPPGGLCRVGLQLPELALQPLDLRLDLPPQGIRPLAGRPDLRELALQRGPLGLQGVGPPPQGAQVLVDIVAVAELLDHLARGKAEPACPSLAAELLGRSHGCCHPPSTARCPGARPVLVAHSIGPPDGKRHATSVTHVPTRDHHASSRGFRRWGTGAAWCDFHPSGE